MAVAAVDILLVERIREALTDVAFVARDRIEEGYPCGDDLVFKDFRM